MTDQKTGEILDAEAVDERREVAASTGGDRRGALEHQDMSLMAVIERIASRDDVDVDRMERLLQMRANEEDRIRAIAREDAAEAARRAFLRDMALVQAEIKPIAHNRANEHTRSTYATLAAIEIAVTPILTKYGFSTSASPVPCELKDHIRVRLVIGHKEGHERAYEDNFPLDIAGSSGKVNKTGIQAKGSTQTYGRRYLKASALDLSFFADNDGNTAEKPDAGTITADQFLELRQLLEDSGSDERVFISAYGGGPDTLLEEFPAKMFEGAAVLLRRKAASVKAKADAASKAKVDPEDEGAGE